MRTLFLDTGVFIALVSRRDPSHARAHSLSQRIAEREWSYVTTSDFVVAEALNYAQRKLRTRDAVERVVGLAFGTEHLTPIVKDVQRLHAGRYAEAADLLRREFDRGLSFTDWTTVVLMREARIDDLATFDAGFRGVVNVVPL